MKIYIPDYYKEFQCIAGQCKDNCCIGWDIMIDEKSYERYQKVTTDFKDRLNQGIQHGKEPQFNMDEQNRCVFLNKDNLCDIYIELGESALCEICTQHPRFHNEDVQSENICIVPHNILKKMKQKDYLEYWFDFYEELDYMNEEFKTLIHRAKKDLNLKSECHTNDIYIERLMNYFIYRHFIKSYEDDNFLDKIKFAILSVLIIQHIDQFCQNHEIPYGFIDIARMYSKEIEYSQENMESIYEELLFE